MYDVIGIGQPLIDICCEISEEFLEENDLEKGQFHMATKELFLKVHDKLNKSNFVVEFGGSVPNTIAGMKLIDYSLKVAEYGMLGKDEYGKKQHENIKQKGIGDMYKDHDNLSSGVVLALITPDAERTFLVYLGAAVELESKDIDIEIIQNAKIIHTTGYEFESPKVRTAIRKAIVVAKENKNLISFDLADPGVVQRNIIELKAFVKENVDILFANEEEVMEFTGKTIEDAVEVLSEMVDYLVLKKGKNGSIIIDKNKNRFDFEAFEVDAKDTTGAGDMFSAAVLWGISKGINMNEVGIIASYASAKVVEKVGARLSELDIEEFM
jgi:sugar/nucleoside kinase (ribokinase family)